ncbi:MAG: hypothetical protein RIQ89_73, partial [Bacteroidota bacterium]
NIKTLVNYSNARLIAGDGERIMVLLKFISREKQFTSQQLFIFVEQPNGFIFSGLF